MKRTREALKALKATIGSLRYSIVRNEKIFLTGKKSFCKEAGEFFLSAKKKLFAVENKEVILSIWSSHGNKNSPGCIARNLQVDEIIHCFYCLIKIPNGGRFFQNNS